ncbi:MAG: hypothetical protein HGB00_08385 [Chlorobiaceae bacterium]|nr:hypothetical protein [Chlorobiaceae bacterium]
MPTQDAAYSSTYGMGIVGNNRAQFRDEFFSFDTANVWDLVQTGAGMALNLGGNASGSRYLAISTGMTANSETILQTKASFMLPCKLSFGLSMSQRIADQEVFVELVSIDSSGAVETSTLFPSSNLNNAANAASIKFDGATTANAINIIRGYGVSELASGSLAFLTTAASGAPPNFFPATVFEINADSEEVVFGARAIDSLAGMTLAAKRTQNLPDTSKRYKVRIRVRNLASSPASSTDVRLHFVRVVNATQITVDMARHMGRTSDVADSLPVSIAAPMPALVAGSALIGDISMQYRAGASGGASIKHIVSIAGTNAQVVKNSAGRLLGWQMTNTTASWRYLKIYNTNVAPTPGTTTVIMTIAIPPGQISDFMAEGGLAFSIGISCAILAGSAVTDNTPIAAGDVVGNIFYA